MPAFLSLTQGFRREYTALYDFVSVTGAALWNMRWQVRGYRESHPAATKADLMGRFVVGSGVGSANLPRFADSPWGEQTEQLGRVMLYTVISLYERWLEGLSFLSKADRIRCQIPTISSGGNGHGGLDVRDVVAQVQSRPSAVMMTDYAARLRRDEYYSLLQLDDLLIAYRFFKEMRNTFAHRSPLPDQRLLDAYNALSALPAPPYGKTKIPHIPVAPNLPVKVTLAGAQAASVVVLKLVTTLDTEMSLSAVGENEMVDRWKASHSSLVQLRGKSDSHERRLANSLTSLGLPRPDSAGAIKQLFESLGLIRV